MIPGLAYGSLGLAGEAGEVANLAKKVYRDGEGRLTPEIHKALVDELGDVLWYVSQLAYDLGVTLEGVARDNVQKLSDRYAGIGA